MLRKIYCELSKITCILKKENNSDSQAVSNSKNISPTGLYDAITGQPVFAVLDTDNSVIEKYYFNDQGDKIMTTGNFTKATQAVQPQPDYDNEKSQSYETMIDGAIERVDVHTKYVDGNIDSYEYTHAGTTDPYNVVDITRLMPKPIKVTMGDNLHVEVSGVTALPSLPIVTNSQGQNFPQHSKLTVEADGSNNVGGVAYTIDGTDPTDDKKNQVSVGQMIELDSHAEIENLRMIAINDQGDVDATLTVGVTYELNNIAEDKDGV